MAKEYIPDVIKVDFKPSEVEPRGGIGRIGEARLTLRDHVMSDFFTDPYFRDRGYDTSRGTYWGKWLARNPFAEGKKIVVRTGFKTDPIDDANFQDHTFFIEQITGPDQRREVTIIAKDILKFANDDRAQCPAPNSATLAGDITAGATTLTLSPSGIGNSEFDASGTIAIGTELMTFTRSGDVMTVVRGTDGTTADSHSQDDAVQQCKRFTNQRVDDILYFLLTDTRDGAGIDPAFIDFAAWQTEAADWLQSCVFANVIIVSPEGVNKLINELCTQCMVQLWWDEVLKLIGFRAIRPPIGFTVTSLDYTNSIIQDSIVTDVDPEDRLSAVLIHYGIRDRFETEEKASNFNYHNYNIDTDAESEDLGYGSRRIKVFFSRWLDQTNDAVASALTGRLLSRFRNPPRRLTVDVDARFSSIKLADIVSVTVREVQDETGLPKTMSMVVLKTTEIQNGHVYRLELQDTGLAGRYGVVAPNGFNPYSSETQARKDKYVFICYNTGVFLDGTPAYRII